MKKSQKYTDINKTIIRAEDVGFNINEKTRLPLKVTGTGYHLPDKIVSNKNIEEDHGVSSSWIEMVSGIKNRNVCSDNEHCSDLGAEASKMALEESGLKANELDLIILSSTCPDFSTPPTANIIQEKLNAINAKCFDIEVACMGYIWGIFIASQFLSTGVFNNILVVSSELTSRGANYQDKETFILLGDGAGAAVLAKGKTKGSSGVESRNKGEGVEHSGGILSYYFGSDGTRWDYATILAGGSKYSSYYKDEDIGKYLFNMKGRAIYKFAVMAINEILEKLTQGANITKDRISWVIPHQANLRILEGAIRRSGIEREKWIINVQERGNTSGASIAIALAEARSKGLIKEGDIIALIGFGAGLNWGGLLLTW